MIFDSADTFRKAIRAHFVKHKRDVKFKVNDRDRVRAVCNSDGCEWMVFASLMGDDKKTFKLKTLNDKHTCGMVFKNKFVNSRRIAERYVGQWSANPDWNYSGVAQQVRENLVVDISEWQFYRAKTAAMQMIEGTIKEQYARLWDYCAELKRANPGSTVQMKCTTIPVEDKPHFQRLYICLEGLKTGWRVGCRPIIGLDVCFIKGHHKGQLLAAVGVNANNQMYPIAYAIVESETRDSWRWFLELLNVDLQLNNSGHISWITDKQKGLLDEMEKMKMASPSAFEWLAAKDPSHLSRAFLREGAKCDMLCNNMCEAFNSTIVQARDKPIITLLEMIHTYMMKRLTRKRAEIEKWKHPMGPKVYRYVEKIKSLSVYCTPTFSGNNTFQVEAGLQNQFVVDLEGRTCACRKWQLVDLNRIMAIFSLFWDDLYMLLSFFGLLLVCRKFEEDMNKFMVIFSLFWLLV
ncbi:hypothetical protein UlMin_043973 [Ulmus minor]